MGRFARLCEGMALVASVSFFSCTTSTLSPAVDVAPTDAHPLRACAVTCPAAAVHFTDDLGRDDGGFIFRRQHLCRGGTRWFREIWLVGASQDYYLACDGPPAPGTRCLNGQTFFKQDVAIGTCHDMLRSIIDSREPERRGQHPGEPDVPGQ